MYGIVRQHNRVLLTMLRHAITDDADTLPRPDDLPETQHIDQPEPLQYREIHSDLLGFCHETYSHICSTNK
jgi:hypothetical protein